MSMIDIDLAMAHLLAEPEDQILVQAQLDASEEAAKQFLQRRFNVEVKRVDEVVRLWPVTRLSLTVG